MKLLQDQVRPPAAEASVSHESLIDQYNQPNYDQEALEIEQENLKGLDGIANPVSILNFGVRLEEMAIRKMGTVIILGNCSVDPDLDPEAIKKSIEQINAQRTLVKSMFPQSSFVTRSINMAAKRRSEPVVYGPDGKPILEHHGLAVNGVELDQRTADPKRLTLQAQHAQIIYDRFMFSEGGILFSAHDLLLTAFEEPFIRKGPDGKLYLMSATMPWLGYNVANNVDTPQSDQAAKVENVIGVKIGPETTPRFIRDIHSKLNPHNTNGKIAYMLRFGEDDEKGKERAAKAIASLPSRHILMWDGHGITERRPSGLKTRKVAKFITGIYTTQRVLKNNGLHLHGLNLEMNGLGSEHYECMDDSGREPNGKAVVDPELNLSQGGEVLQAFNNARLN